MATLSFKINAEWDKVQKLREEIAKLKQEIKGTDAIQNPVAFNNLNSKLQQTSKELGNVTNKVAQTAATVETDFKKKIFDASQSVNGFTEKIIAQKAVVKDVEADVRRLGDAYRDAKKYSPMSADGKLAEWKAAKRALEEEKAALFGLTQEQANARLSVKKLRDEYALFKDEGGGTAQTMDLLTSKMKGIAATVMGGMGLKELASHIISVRGEFESMETSLKVLLGGNQQRLDSIMGQIKEYALASPLNTKDMVGAVQMMTSFGIEAEKSIDYLKAIGDISMGDTGKFNGLALAFSQMSASGKLMGQDLNQMINQGFNPLEEISRKTGKSIGELKEQMSKGAISSKMVQDAFISATSAGGKFYGMSQEGSKNLNGQISMLQESFDMMFNEIGTKGEPVIMSAVQLGTKLVENYEQVGRVILGLIETYGAYRVGLAIATVAENGHTLAMTLASAQILLTQKAQALLNATMLSNPYVLAATALGTLVGVIIATNDGLTTAERAQNAFNDTVKQAEEAQAKYNKETEQAISLASSDSTATDDRRKAMNLLISRYPTIIRKYIDEEGHLKNILGLKREIAAMDGKGEIIEYKGKASDARQAANAFKLVKQAKQKAVTAGMSESEYTHFLTKEQQSDVKWANTWYEKNANPSWFRRGTTQERLEFATNFAKSANYKAGRTATGNAISNLQDAIGKMSKQRLLTLRNTLIKAQKTKKNVKLPYKELQGVALNQDDISKLFIFTDGVYTSKTKKTATTKKDLDDQKKALQAQLEGLSEVEAKGKKGAALKKKIAALSKREDAAYSTSSSGSTSKSGRRDNAAKIDTVKIQNNIDAQKAALSQAQVELENQVEQSRIDALMEGSEKTLAAMKLAHKKELEQIDKQRLDYLKKKQDEAKAEFEANPKNKNKAFNASSVKLSTDEEKKFTEIRTYTEKKHANENAEMAKATEASMRDYLKQYGTYEEKRLAISKEYAEKTAKAKNEGERKTLRKQEQAEYNNLDLDNLKKSINWEYVFGNLDNVDKTTAGAVKDQLEQFVSLSKELTPEQIKTMTDAIAQLQDKMDLAEPLKSIKEARKEYAAAKVEYDKYKSDLDTAKANGDTAGEKKATAGMTKASQKMTKAKNKEEKSFKEVTDIVQDYAKALQEAGNVIGGTAGECMELAASALSVGVSMAQGIDKFGKAVSSMEKAVAILAIIEAALQAIQVIMNVFGGKADSTLTDYVSTMDTYIKLLDEDISSLNDSMGNTKNTMKDTVAYYEQLIALEKASATAVKSQSQVWLNSGASKGFLGIRSKASEGKKIVKQMEKDLASGNEEVRKFYEQGYDSLNQFFKKVNGRLANSVRDFGRMDWIWRLSDEDLTALSKDANAMALLGDTLSSAVKEYADKTKTVTDKLNDEFSALLDVSYDDFYDGFTDMISTMDNDSQNFANNFAEYMRKALIKDMVASQYKSQLESLYKQAGEYATNGTLDDHVDELREQYTRLATSAQEQVRMIDSITGYSEDESQKATANGISSITYEQANNIVALTTAGNISCDQIKDKLTLMNANIEVFKVAQAQTRDIADELRTIQANSYIELQGIHEDTTSMNKAIKTMSSDVSDIKKHIKDM